MERTWFSEVTGKRKGSRIVNVNGEVNCKVNEFATESAETLILKGYVHFSKQHQGMCQALELNRLNYDTVSIVSSMLGGLGPSSTVLSISWEGLGTSTQQGPLPAHCFHSKGV